MKVLTPCHAVHGFLCETNKVLAPYLAVHGILNKKDKVLGSFHVGGRKVKYLVHTMLYMTF